MKHQQQKVAMPFSRLKGNLHFHVHICSTPAQGYHEYIDDNLPPESPYLYGLHPNAEIGFLTVTSERLFRTVLEMQPKESDAVGGSGASREEKVSENAAALGGVAGGGGGWTELSREHSSVSQLALLACWHSSKLHKGCTLLPRRFYWSVFAPVPHAQAPHPIWYWHCE